MEVPGYNLSKLEPESTHYVVIGFSAPFCLHLPNDSYKVPLNPIQQRINYCQIMIAERRRGNSQSGLLPGVQDTEKFADRHGIYYYSSILVYIPIEENIIRVSQEKNNLWEHIERNHSSYRAQAVNSTNRLIATYRHVTGECHIRQLTGNDMWFDYSVALVSVKNPSESYFMPVYDLHSILPKIPDIPETAVMDIKDKISANYQIPLAEELLLNAYDWLDQGNYRMAVIEAETAFEAALLLFLREHYRHQLSVLTKIEGIKSFGRLIDDDIFKNALASKGKDFSKSKSRYRDDWDKFVWQVRGNLVHGRIEDVTESEAIKSLGVVEETLKDLLGRQPTTPWRFTL